MIDSVFSGRSYSAFFPRDIASAVTMSLINVFWFSFSASSVGKISHAPVPASPPRERVFVFVCSFSLLCGLLFGSCPHCLSEPNRACTLSVLLPPASVFYPAFGHSECSVTLPWVGYLFFVCLCLSVSGPFRRWYLGRLASRSFALDSTDDAVAPSVVPRYQPSSYSNLFFASSRAPVCSDLLSSGSQCTRLIGFCLAR